MRKLSVKIKYISDVLHGLERVCPDLTELHGGRRVDQLRKHLTRCCIFVALGPLILLGVSLYRRIQKISAQ
jgi:hypothetical protein